MITKSHAVIQTVTRKHSSTMLTARFFSFVGGGGKRPPPSPSKQIPLNADPPCEQTDRQVYRHYLPATLQAVTISDPCASIPPQKTLADRGGASGQCPLLASQNFSIFTKLYLGTLWRGGAPPTWNPTSVPMNIPRFVSLHYYCLTIKVVGDPAAGERGERQGNLGSTTG